MNAQEARDKARHVKQQLDTKRIEFWIEEIYKHVEQGVQKGKFSAQISFQKVEEEEPDDEVVGSLKRLFGQKGFEVDVYGSQNRYFKVSWK